MERQRDHDLLRQALQAAQSISDSFFRARALSTLAPRLEGEARADALRQALQAAQSISDSFFRARVLSALAPRLADHPDLLRQALQTRPGRRRLPQVRPMVSRESAGSPPEPPC